MDTEDNPRFERVLVTGAAGFAGRHLVAELLSAGYSVSCVDAAPADSAAAAGLPDYVQADLRDREAVRSILHTTAPDAVAHLAAISFVPDAAKDPSRLWNVNIGGTINVVESVLSERPSARILFVSSAQVYGTAGTGLDDAALSEDAPLLPLSLYAVSKVAGEAFVKGCAASRGLDAVIVRPGNHTGPGQSPKFVAVSFARQVLDAARGRLNGAIRVGNLDSVRDFSDVRDVVRAYRLVLEKGRTGAIYNVSAGAVIRIGELLDRLRRLAGTDVASEKDDSFWRPTDRCASLSTAALRADTGWEPRIPLDDTLRDILTDLSR